MTNTVFRDIVQSLKRIISEEFEEESCTKLNELFDSCNQLKDLIEDSSLPSNDKELQDAIQVCIKTLERCTLLVNDLELFSSNEAAEDLQTSSIKFLLLPALLGSLNLSVQNRELAEREKSVQIAEVYFKDFLLRCANYELHETCIKYLSKASNSEDEGFTSIDASSVREQKVQQFKKKKELLDREKVLKQAFQREGSEEYIREYYLVVLERWAVTAIEELDNIKREKDILKMIPKKESSPSKVLPEKKVEVKPFKPFIITKNAAQKQVFGLGYPSMPVMTIDDFYQQRFEKALQEQKQNKIEEQKLNKHKKSLQDAALSGEGLIKEDEEVEKERLIENDDFVTLMKARQWDDWKDDNQRGSGNRYNKG